MSLRRKKLDELSVSGPGGLRDILKAKNLPSSGKKSELVKRLELYKLTKAELQAKAEAKKLPTSGTKAILVRRLQSKRSPPPRCCGEPAKRKASPKKKAAKKRTPRKPSKARCTIGTDGHEYYFKAKAPHKRISDARAGKLGTEVCVTSEARVEGVVEESEVAALLEEGTAPLEQVLPAGYERKLARRRGREEMVRESLKRGEIEEKSLDEINPKIAADLRRSKKEIKEDMLRDSAKPGGITLVKVNLFGDDPPLFEEILQENFTPPDDPTDLYDDYDLGSYQYLATVPSGDLDVALKTGGNVVSLPTADVITPPGLFRRAARATRRFFGRAGAVGEEFAHEYGGFVEE